MEKSERNFVVAVLLCLFFGSMGIHRFYAGRIGSGVAMLLTLGGLGVWTLVDFIMLVCGSFKDRDGKSIKS